MFCEFQPNQDKHKKTAKKITAAKELKTTTAKQTAHQQTKSSSIFFDTLISRGRIV
jgi:septal ring-binding cell division protein DamX